MFKPILVTAFDALKYPRTLHTATWVELTRRVRASRMANLRVVATNLGNVDATSYRVVIDSRGWTG